VTDLQAVIISVPPTLAALAALINPIRNGKALNQIHLTMNGRLDQLLKAAQAQGKVDEQDAQAIRDKLL
jgi:hypothetical protein